MQNQGDLSMAGTTTASHSRGTPATETRAQRARFSRAVGREAGWAQPSTRDPQALTKTSERVCPVATHSLTTLPVGILILTWATRCESESSPKSSSVWGMRLGRQATLLSPVFCRGTVCMGVCGEVEVFKAISLWVNLPRGCAILTGRARVFGLISSTSWAGICIGGGASSQAKGIRRPQSKPAKRNR